MSDEYNKDSFSGNGIEEAAGRRHEHMEESFLPKHGMTGNEDGINAGNPAEKNSGSDDVAAGPEENEGTRFSPPPPALSEEEPTDGTGILREEAAGGPAKPEGIPYGSPYTEEAAFSAPFEAEETDFHENIESGERMFDSSADLPRVPVRGADEQGVVGQSRRQTEAPVFHPQQPVMPPYQPQQAGYPPVQQAPYPGTPQQVQSYGMPVQTGYTPAGYNPVPQQPYAQPGYPQYQYAQPQYYPGVGGPAAPPPVAPKKKMSVGLKVFLWILSILAVGTIIGFAGFSVYTAVTDTGLPNGNITDLLPDTSTPEEGQYPVIPPYGDEGEEKPEVNEDVLPKPNEEKPDIDVVPNHEGITIWKRPEGAELTADEIYEKVKKSTVTVGSTLIGENGYENTSTGTGIIATSDGYIITNSHVVLNSKSTSVKIITYDEQEYDAVVVGVDRTTDLAVLKTNDHGFTPAEFGDAEELSIGEWVIAIGNPGGVRFSSSLTRGVVSGLNRSVGQYSENGMTYIQTDAAINPGNSGGPLLNMHGQVVGINSSKIVTTGYEGMGFAIPVSKAQNIINELFADGYIKGRTRLGIIGSDIKEMEMALYAVPAGFRIIEINEESAFSGTEAQENDIITAIGGEKVNGLTAISNLLLKYHPGDEVTVTLYRIEGNGKGREIEVTITLLEDKGQTQE